MYVKISKLAYKDKLKIIVGMRLDMRYRGLLEMMLLGALASTSYLFYKLALVDITPFTLVSLRIGLATLILLLLLKFRRIALPSPIKYLSLWKHCAILGFFTNGFPFVCFCYSLETIPTSLSALVNGTTPVLTVLLANFLLENEGLTFERTLGVILGLSGFGVLFLPALLDNASNNTLDLDPIGILFSFLGSSSYAIGMIYARKYTQKAPPLVVPTLQLLTSLSYLIPLAFLLESPWTLHKASLTAWGGILGLSVIGTVCGFIMYHRVLIRFGVTTLAMSNYLLPIFGTILGIVFLNESITLNFVVASCLIMLGIATINGVLPFKKRAVAIPPS